MIGEDTSYLECHLTHEPNEAAESCELFEVQLQELAVRSGALRGRSLCLMWRVQGVLLFVICTICPQVSPPARAALVQSPNLSQGDESQNDPCSTITVPLPLAGVVTACSQGSVSPAWPECRAAHSILVVVSTTVCFHILSFIYTLLGQGCKLVKTRQGLFMQPSQTEFPASGDKGVRLPPGAQETYFLFS